MDNEQEILRGVRDYELAEINYHSEDVVVRKLARLALKYRDQLLQLSKLTGDPDPDEGELVEVIDRSINALKNAESEIDALTYDIDTLRERVDYLETRTVVQMLTDMQNKVNLAETELLRERRKTEHEASRADLAEHKLKTWNAIAS